MGFWDFLPWRKKDKLEYPADLPEDIKIAFEECEKEVAKHGRTKDPHRILWETINRLYGPQSFARREPTIEASPGPTPAVSEPGRQEGLQNGIAPESKPVESPVAASQSESNQPSGDNPQGVQRIRRRSRRFNPI